MLYRIAHIIRDRMPWIWRLLELINEMLFVCRYGSRLKKRGDSITVPGTVIEKNVEILPIDEIATEELVAFFERQPKEAFDHFKPHDFDVDTIKRLQRNRAFLGYVVVSEGEIVGYCFIRAYCHGKGFRGRMVDWNHRNQGIGTMMNRWMNKIGFGIGLRLFESISLKNPASCRTVEKSGGYEVVEKLDESNLFVKVLNDKKNV